MAESPSIKTISNFKSVLKGGGARPNLFEVQIPEFPAYVTKDTETIKDLTFLCKGSATSSIERRSNRRSLQGSHPEGCW